MNKSSKCNISDLRQRFFSLIEKKGYSAQYRYYMQIRFASLEAFMLKRDVADYSPETGDMFLSDFINSRDVSKSTTSAVKVFIEKVNDVYYGRDFLLRHTGKEKSLPSGFEKVLNNYVSHCIGKGNKPSTIRWKTDNCQKFCVLLSQLGCNSPEQIINTAVANACLKMGNNDSWRVVREFLHFLYETSAVDRDYSYIPPKAPKKSVLPSVYSPDEIRKIESAVDTSTTTGKRDLCMILLASRLAMRAGDIVKLSFGEIDFENEYISYIQEKTDKHQRLPLLPELKEAMKDYINNARPDSADDTVFLSLYAPHRRLTTSVMRRITRQYMKRANIQFNNRRHGSHIFRSSAATSMVNDGVSYDIIKRILGHTSPNAVRHYAELDINNLRRCALPVPPPTGSLKDILEGRDLL